MADAARPARQSSNASRANDAQMGQLGKGSGRLNREELERGLTRIWLDVGSLDQASIASSLGGSIVRAWRNIRISPVTTLLSTVTISIALLLLTLFLLGAENVRSVVRSSTDDISFTIFLRPEATTDEIEALKRELQALAAVDRVSFTSPEVALRELRQSLGEAGTVLDGVEQSNPLPASLQASLTEEIEGGADAFVTKLREYAFVEQVQYSRGLLERLGELLGLIEWGGTIAVILVLGITGFIISNTIGLALYSHRSEIEIMQLVGATPRSIQLPYLIEGAIQGLLGATAALGICAVVRGILAGWLEKAETVRLFVREVVPLTSGNMILVLFLGVSVGVCGSFVALRRFLKD